MYTIDDIQIFCDGLDHPECVAVHPDGSVWTGGEAGQIYRISPDGKHIEQVCTTSGFVLGIAFSPDCSWLAVCDLRAHCIWKLELAARKLSLFARSAGSEAITIPNYPVFDDEGRLYVSESGGFRTITGRIYRFDEQGWGEIWHPGPFNFANGMALSPDRKYLYIVCTWLPGVERIEIGQDGLPGRREVYVTMPGTCPDGIAFDEQGRIYVSCYTPNTIFIIDEDRRLSTLVHDWEAHTLSNPTNIAFGGPQFTGLYIANLGRWHISLIQTASKGLRLPHQELPHRSVKKAGD